MKEKIGFIGVGLMGHGMAKNIVEKGWPLTVLGHRRREAVEDLKSARRDRGGFAARARARERRRRALRDRFARRSRR